MADQLEQLVRSVIRRLDNLESEVIAPTVASLQLLDKRVRDNHDDDDPTGMQKGHQPWKCGACRALLGYYDTEKDVLRIRVKDFHVHVHVGTSGWVEVPCRRCGFVNREQYSPPRG